jgi:hypothetical protein
MRTKININFEMENNLQVFLKDNENIKAIIEEDWFKLFFPEIYEFIKIIIPKPSESVYRSREEVTECPICLEEPVWKKTPLVTICSNGHKICLLCYFTLLVHSNNSCPLCRNEIQSYLLWDDLDELKGKLNEQQKWAFSKEIYKIIDNQTLPRNVTIPLWIEENRSRDNPTDLFVDRRGGDAIFILLASALVSYILYELSKQN